MKKTFCRAFYKKCGCCINIHILFFAQVPQFPYNYIRIEPGYDIIQLMISNQKYIYCNSSSTDKIYPSATYSIQDKPIVPNLFCGHSTSYYA